MSNPVRYFDLIREMKNAFNHRLRLVTYARQQGIKAAARVFHTTVATVRKGLRRHQAQGLKGLQELSRAPRSCPHKIQGELAARVVALRRQLPTFGAQRLKREWALPLSHVAIQRLWREHGLLRRRCCVIDFELGGALAEPGLRRVLEVDSDTKDLDD